MNYLIDGHNLIGQMPDLSLADEDDETQLVLKLRRWTAAGKKRRVFVIFDAGLPGGRARQLSSGPVQVQFAPQGQTADELLIRRINRVKNPAEHTVVSSDQVILAAARARGLPHLQAGEFARRMLGERRTAPPPPPAESDDPSLSQAEVEEWLALFGPEQPRPKRSRPRPALEPPEAEPPDAQPEARPKSSASPGAYKSGQAELDEEDVQAWLELFGDKDEGG